MLAVNNCRIMLRVTPALIDKTECRSGCGIVDVFADMRKAMSRDVHKESVIPLDRPIYPHELESD